MIYVAQLKETEMTVIAIPHVLREKLGEHGAEALVGLLDKVAEERIEHKIEETKAVLAVEIEKLRTEIAKSRAEIIRWTFTFVVGQFWAIVGTLFAFFRK